MIAISIGCPESKETYNFEQVIIKFGLDVSKFAHVSIKFELDLLKVEDVSLNHQNQEVEIDSPSLGMSLVTTNIKFGLDLLNFEQVTRNRQNKEAKIGHAEFRFSYLSSQNKEFPCFNLPRRECDLLMALLRYTLLDLEVYSFRV